jgi:hypothetical protein
MYDGIKKAIAPTIEKCAPLKSLDGEIINDKRKHMDRWRSTIWNYIQERLN